MCSAFGLGRIGSLGRYELCFASPDRVIADAQVPHDLATCPIEHNSARAAVGVLIVEVK